MGRRKEYNETKREAKSASKWRFTDLLAFTGLAIAALLIALGPILQWVFDKMEKGNVLHIINMISQYLLLAAVAIPAWCFVCRKRMGWKIFYLIILAVYIVGTVLGVAL